MLLVTERAYYFEVCKVKKFNHIYFYSLPKNIFIYEELLSSFNEDNKENPKNNVIAIYNQFD